MRPSSIALFLVLASSALACTSREPAPTKNAEAAAPVSTPASPPASRALELGVYTSDASGFDTRSYWIDTGREVVVFDAQFTEPLAEKLVAAIRAATSSPIRFVVVTHPNPDKFNGARVFQALGAKVVASEATARAIPDVHAYKRAFFVGVAKMFTDATYPKEAKVDVTFHGDLDLPLEGSVAVHLHELAHAGVSSTQTIAVIPSAKALVVGDLVHAKTHAWLEGGIVGGKPTPSIEAWKQALNELLAFPGTTVYGGRGEPAAVDEAVRDERAYLDRMQSLVARYVDGLGPAKSELFGPKAGEHHKKLAALAQKELPDCALPYLVEYGVYGLANQLASR